jgi:LuxR family transcriptional regulator, maltose regulon positive regulatory protein
MLDLHHLIERELRMTADLPPLTSILKTKVRKPKTREKIVMRSALLTRLGECANQQIVLLCAPAGSGKTTLLSEWLKNNERLSAWLTLDEADNQTERFFAYLVSAIQTCLPEIGQGAQALLASAQPTPADSFINSLINEIEDQGRPFTLVLDDYHNIHQPAIHDAVNYWVEHLPEGMQLIIASRTTPPLPLGRLRARNQLVEFRRPDLQFTAEEAAVFLNQTMGLDLSDDDIQALEKRTEGWIAGLQLAALALKDKPEPGQFIKKFHGSHRFILDYLVEEVLHQQSEETQQFMLRTSLLERMNADLCQELTGRIDTQFMLQRLAQDNLFVIALDDEQLWFRYHTLFRDLLRYQLEQVEPGAILDLHRRAATWYEKNGFLAEATEHYLSAHETSHAIRVLDLECQTILSSSTPKLLFGRLDNLPPSLFRLHPQLHMYYAWALITTGQFMLVEGRLKLAEEDMAKSEIDPSIQANIDATRAIIAFSTGNFQVAIETGQKALQSLSPKSDLYSSVLTGLAVSYNISGDLEHAAETFIAAVENSKDMKQYAVAISSLCNLGDIYNALGHLKKAEATFQEGIDFAARFMNDNPIVGMAHAGLSSLYYEWNQVDKAIQTIQQAIPMIEAWGNVDVQISAYVRLAFFLLTAGNFDLALETAEKADHCSQTMPASIISPQTSQLFKAQFLLRAEKYDDALLALQNIPNTEPIPFIFNRDLENQLWAETQYHLAKTRNDSELMRSALEKLDALIIKEVNLCERTIELHLRAEKALALAALDLASPAVAELITALEMAEQEGYCRAFLDLGPEMETLLKNVPESSPAYNYAQYLRSQFSTSAIPTQETLPAGQTSGNRDLVEPLSEREIQVLHLVVEGFSNQEIADRLFLAPGTVKRHIHNIFGKLGVSTRAQAIAQARKHQLT